MKIILESNKNETKTSRIQSVWAYRLFAIKILQQLQDKPRIRFSDHMFTDFNHPNVLDYCMP